MTKRVKMNPAGMDRDSHTNGMAYWPIVIAGAVAGVVWSGLDPATTKLSATELVRLMPLLIHPSFVHACF